MNKNAYFLVFDGLADWEAALALCEISKHPNIDVVTVGFSTDSITTLGGLRILPQIKVDNIQQFEIKPATKMINLKDVKKEDN